MAASNRKITKLVSNLVHAKTAEGRLAVTGELVAIGASAVPVLVKLLDDKDYKVRMAAAEALGQIGAEAAVEPLIRSLGDTSKNVQQVAAEGLTKVGEPAISALLDALIGKDQLARKWAAEALGNIGDVSVAQQLIARLNDSNIDVQRAAVTALGDLKSKRAIEPLIEVVQSDKIDLARAATQALGQIRSAIGWKCLAISATIAPAMP